MIKAHYLDSKTRVKLVSSRIGYKIELQRKKWYGWKEVACTYPEVMRNYSMAKTVEYLLWHEKQFDVLGMAKKIFEA